MSGLPPILLVGAGGHAGACIDVIEQEKRFVVAGLMGLAHEVGGSLLGYPVLGVDEELPAFLGKYVHALVTVGQIKTPTHRIRLFGELKQAGFSMQTIISPHAYVSEHTIIGEGSIIMHGAIVNAGATIGRNCIINSRSLIEHDAVIGDHCHVSTASVVNGGAIVGEGTFVGSGSVIREVTKVGKMCVIGMGQRILADCMDGTKMPMQKA